MKTLQIIIACSLFAIAEQNIHASLPDNDMAVSITQRIRLQDLPLETRRYICDFLQPQPEDYTLLQKQVIYPVINIENVRTLLMCGFDPNVTATSRFQADLCLETPLYKVAASSELLHSPKEMYQKFIIAKLLLRNGADIQKLNTWQESPLHAAVKALNINMIQLLIQSGARLDATNYWHNTPLDQAKKNAMNHNLKISTRKKYYEICTMLEQLGAPSSVTLEPMPTDEIIIQQAELELRNQRMERTRFDVFFPL